MRGATIAIMTAFPLVMVGCYDFASPLDATPQLPVDQALVGKWRCLPNDPDETQQAFTVFFSPAGERTYDVVLQGEEGKEPEHLPAYSSRLNRSMFLNVHDPDGHSTSKPWTLVRYSFLRPNIVWFELVNDVPIRDDRSPAALRRDLIRLGEAADLYEDSTACVRVAEQK